MDCWQEMVTKGCISEDEVKRDVGKPDSFVRDEGLLMAMSDSMSLQSSREAKMKMMVVLT